MGFSRAGSTAAQIDPCWTVSGSRSGLVQRVRRDRSSITRWWGGRTAARERGSIVGRAPWCMARINSGSLRAVWNGSRMICPSSSCAVVYTALGLDQAMTARSLGSRARSICRACSVLVFDCIPLRRAARSSARVVR